MASGHTLDAASERDIAIPALMLKRSSRVMPGFLGTPAGMITILLPEVNLVRRGEDQDLLTIWPKSECLGQIRLTIYQAENYRVS